MQQNTFKFVFIFLFGMLPLLLFAAQCPTNSPAPMEAGEWKAVLLAILLFGLIPIAGILLSVFFAPLLAVIIPSIIYTSVSILAAYVIYLAEGSGVKWKTTAAICAILFVPLALIIAGIIAAISWLWITGIVLLFPFFLLLYVIFAFSHLWKKV